MIENSAWSCSHRLARWVTGCGCTPGESHWKGALGRALDNLACDLDHLYVREAAHLGATPWRLRDAYIAVVMGQMDGPTLLTELGLSHISHEETERLLALLEAQHHRQRMYASCTFFFEDLDRLEPCYAIANGIRALTLSRHATGDDLSHSFRRDLGIVVSGRSNLTAADIFDDMLSRAQV